MSYYVCECGEQFEEDQQGAREHMLEQHLDLIESRFEEFFDDANADLDDDRTDVDIYDDAIDDVTEELLDLFEEN
jgi:hypothetical protein